MSGENIAAVRAVYEEWAKGNFRAGVELYDPEILMVQHRGFPEAGSYLGVDGVRRYMRVFLEAWEEVSLSAEELVEAGDSVVVAVVHRGTGKGSGAEPNEFRYFHVWSFRGGRVIRLDAIREKADALEAAGITG
jgi:ketosteroid isomerase-like protein